MSSKLVPCTSQQILIAVMSYNRGEYLVNCVASIERHLPGARIEIFDDGSDCSRTLKTLEKFERRHRVIRRRKALNPIYLGGLHDNMNRAMDEAREENYAYLFVIQEDLQFVRDCDDVFFESVNQIFSSDDAIVEVQPIFFKGFFLEADTAQRYRICRNPDYYENRNSGFSDVGLFRIERLLATGFRFGDSETQNAQRARELGLRCVSCVNPVLMYTPWPRTVRRRRRRTALFVWLNELGIGAGLHPFEPMSCADIARLVSRSIDEYPVAEKFLRTRRRLRQPWWYTNCADMAKLQRMRYLVTFKWLIDGPVEYIRFVESKKQAGELSAFEQRQI